TNAATGTVHVQAGAVIFRGGVQADGTPGTTTFQADPGATLEFGGANATLGSRTSVHAGQLILDNFTLTIQGSYQAAATFVVPGYAGGSAALICTGAVDLAGRDLTVDGRPAHLRAPPLLDP